MCSNDICGQKINDEKLNLAKEMRSNMTVSEKILWEKLRRNQVLNLHFRRQQILDGFIVDFYCSKARLVIEVDGEVHKNQEEYDKLREDVLIKRNLMVVRFSNNSILNDLQDVMQKILEICKKRI